MTPVLSAAGFQLPCSTCILSSDTFLWGCKNFTFPSLPRGESNEQKLHHVIMVIMPVNRAPHSINTVSTSHCWEQLWLQLCSCSWRLGTDLSPSPDLKSKAQNLPVHTWGQIFPWAWGNLWGLEFNVISVMLC